ncbi:MAG: hypothetical protein PVH61_41445 [Candidatus Aminicenantes bacterium]|jgi:hypothetical protein
MKKVLTIFIVPYLVILGITFYIFYGPGLFTGFETLKWKDIEIKTPKSYNVKSYESEGWEVYSMQKVFEEIRIARKSPAVDVTGFPKHKHAGKIIYQFSPGPGSIYYISRVRKTQAVVFATNIDDVTLYFRIATASVFSGTHVLDKMMAHCFYKGQKIPIPNPSIPLGAYLTDFIFFGGMILPIFIILLVFSLSAKKPAAKYFTGDPVQLEESNVYFSRVKRFQRKNNFCYLLLTTSRLMVFSFGKPVVEIHLHEEKPDIRFEKNKIIIQRPKEKLVLRPSDIETWKNALSPFFY